MRILSLFALICLVGSAVCFDAPYFELSEEERHTNVDYHNHIIDGIVWNNAFKWSNATHANETYLEMLIDDLTAQLDAITTSTFRQCDRLSAICYQCENGAANVSRETIKVMKDAKLFGQDNNMMDTVSEKIDWSTYTLHQNNNVPVWTATLACRANPSCYPTSDSQLIKGELEGERLLKFKRVSGQILIDRINTGARYTYFSSAEAGIKVFSANHGMNLVPDSIMEDYSLTGIFCISAKKRSPIYYTKRGLPLIDAPS